MVFFLNVIKIAYRILVLIGVYQIFHRCNTKTPRLLEGFLWGAVVEEVKTVFEWMNDATIYIPDLRGLEMASIAS